MSDEAFGRLNKFKLGRLRKYNLRNENIAAISSKCHNAYLGDYQSVCRVLGRFLTYVGTKDRTLGIQLLMNGYWEIEVTECVAQNVKPGMKVVDIGANYGYFTLLMAGLVGKKNGMVYAIEANPNIFKNLNKTLKINGLRGMVKASNIAVSDENENEMMFNYSDERGMNGHFAKQKALRDDEKTISVKSNKLDNLIMPGEQVDFIKVDIEGAEKMFWDGSTRVRKDNPQLKILMEFNAKRYHQVSLFLDEIFNEGFKVKRVNTHPGQDKYLSKQDLLDISTDKHIMLLLEKRRP